MANGPTRIVIKLGGACNLHCKHCHSMSAVYKLNEDIFPFLKSLDLDRITFSGGEPLMYMHRIKRIVSEMPKDMNYKIVTNGTLLKPDLVDYFNEHNFHIYFSYDGENSSRDNSYLQCWHELAKVHQRGHAVLYSPENRDYKKLYKEVLELRKKYNLRGDDASVWTNFVHQTSYNPNDSVDRELAQEYCMFMCSQLETDMRKFKAGIRSGLGVLETSFDIWVRKRTWKRGVNCFNENIYSMTLDGHFLLCPYDPRTVVGDIYKGVDWDLVESFIPERCKNCPQWNTCGGSCIANITDNECYISRVMNKHFNKLMVKYGITYEDLVKGFREQHKRVKEILAEDKKSKIRKMFDKVVNKILGRDTIVGY